MYQKLRLSQVWIFLLLVIAFTGLTHAAEQPVTLVHYKFDSRPESLALLQRLADEFHKQNPHIKVEILTGPEGPEYEEKVRVMLAAGTPPDVTEFYTLIAGSLAEAGQFLDLRPYIAKDPRWKAMEMVPAALQGSTWTNGTVFSMPSLIGANILAYNGDLVRTAGLASPSDLRDRWTWETMTSMVRKIARDENTDGVPEKWGNMGRVGLSRILTYMVQAGRVPFDTYFGPRSANFMHPAVVGGARFAADLLDPAVGTTNYNQFIQGNAGFIWIGVFPFAVELARLRQQSDQIDYRVSPWPIGPAKNRATVTEVRGWQIMKASKHQQEAWEWLAFVHLNRVRALEFAQVHGWIPASRLLQNPWLGSLPFRGVEQQMIAVALQSTIEAGNVPTPAGPGVLEVTNAWDQGFADVVAKKAPLETFLERMNDRAAQFLKR